MLGYLQWPSHVPRPSIKVYGLVLVRMRWPLPEKHAIVYLACKPLTSYTYTRMRIRYAYTYTMSKSCRICDIVLSRTHYVALFSRESLASDLANRLSKVVDVPVASEDGLSRFICIPQGNKIVFRTLGFTLSTLGSVPSNVFKVPKTTVNTFDGTDPKVDRIKPKVEHDFFPVYTLQKQTCFARNGLRKRLQAKLVYDYVFFR